MLRPDPRAPVSPSVPGEVVLRRLRTLAPLSEREAALVLAISDQRQVQAAGTELLGEGHLISRPKVLLSGWACRCRVLADGRRQIFTFVVPGDAIGMCLRPEPVAQATTVALTRVIVADAGTLADAAYGGAPHYAGLAAAISTAAVLDEVNQLDQIVRLGRQTAYERLAHLLLELRWRLAAVGLASARKFPLPLTQEVLADALGLSIVHVNRTLQQLRREGLVAVHSGVVELLKPDVLAAASDFRAPQPTREDWALADEEPTGRRPAS